MPRPRLQPPQLAPDPTHAPHRQHAHTQSSGRTCTNWCLLSWESFPATRSQISFSNCGPGGGKHGVRKKAAAAAAGVRAANVRATAVLADSFALQWGVHTERPMPPCCAASRSPPPTHTTTTTTTTTPTHLLGEAALHEGPKAVHPLHVAISVCVQLTKRRCEGCCLLWCQRRPACGRWRGRCAGRRPRRRGHGRHGGLRRDKGGWRGNRRLRQRGRQLDAVRDVEACQPRGRHGACESIHEPDCHRVVERAAAALRQAHQLQGRVELLPAERWAVPCHKLPDLEERGVLRQARARKKGDSLPAAHGAVAVGICHHEPLVVQPAWAVRAAAQAADDAGTTGLERGSSPRPPCSLELPPALRHRPDLKKADRRGEHQLLQVSCARSPMPLLAHAEIQLSYDGWTRDLRLPGA